MSDMNFKFTLQPYQTEAAYRRLVFWSGRLVHFLRGFAAFGRNF